MGGLVPAAHFQREPSGGQTKTGACRSERLVAGEHVPDRLGELARELDLGDLGAALAAEAALGALVALRVGGVVTGVQGGLEEPPAQVARAVFRDWAAPVGVAGLDHTWAEPGVAAELCRRGEAFDIADLGGDGVRVDP